MAKFETSMGCRKQVRRAITLIFILIVTLAGRTVEVQGFEISRLTKRDTEVLESVSVETPSTDAESESNLDGVPNDAEGPLPSSDSEGKPLEDVGTYTHKVGGFSFHNQDNGMSVNDKERSYLVDESHGNYAFNKQQGAFPMTNGGNETTSNSTNISYRTQNQAYKFFNQESELKGGSLSFNNNQGSHSASSQSGTMPLKDLKQMNYPSLQFPFLTYPGPDPK